MKFCPECGTPCEGANFCPGCGKDLRVANTQPQASPQKPQMMVGQAHPTLAKPTYDIAEALAAFVVKLNDDMETYTITGVRDENMKEAIIPDCVTAIADSAFLELPHLKTVTIPGSVKSIGEYAFKDCLSLVQVDLVEGVEFIEYNAFDSCEALKSIHIPSSVRCLGSEAFFNCRSLTEVIFGEGGAMQIESGVFAECSSLQKIKIPQNAAFANDNISGYVAFENCSALTVAYVPKHLVEAFKGQLLEATPCTVIPY